MLKVLSELGFETPSEIQERAIPHLLLEDRDFIGLAQTGTGKTAAFGLPLIERIDPALPFTQALILAPTRELGQQIAKQLAVFGKYHPKISSLAVYGGASIATQIKALRRPQHIIIATPGRLIDLSRRKAVDLSQLRYLVLDEADEMLNMGFQEDIDQILAYTPEDKLTWLFSATMSKEMNKIVSDYMDNPIEVKLSRRNEVNTNIAHQFALVRQSDKPEALIRFIDANPGMRGVVFCRTRRDTQELADELLKRHYKADALHGDLSQQQRDRVMNRFRIDDFQMLIATDVAARGIDVNDLTHVFHFALPDDLSYYTHRSGRTARAGKKGVSIVFANRREQGRIDRLARQLDISFEKVYVPSATEIQGQRIEHWCFEILEQKVNGVVHPKLLDHANLLFGNLTKEELTAKLLAAELEKLNLNNKDLNERPSKPKQGRKSRPNNNRNGKKPFNNKYKKKNGKKKYKKKK